MKCPKHTGDLETRDDTLALTNDRNESFEVDGATAYIWQRCDGETDTADIAEGLSRKLGIPDSERGDVEQAVKSTITHLLNASLLEGGQPQSN